jgi:hypothetical protein
VHGAGEGSSDGEGGRWPALWGREGYVRLFTLVRVDTGPLEYAAVVGCSVPLSLWPSGLWSSALCWMNAGTWNTIGTVLNLQVLECRAVEYLCDSANHSGACRKYLRTSPVSCISIHHTTISTPRVDFRWMRNLTSCSPPSLASHHQKQECCASMSVCANGNDCTITVGF